MIWPLIVKDDMAIDCSVTCRDVDTGMIAPLYR